MCAMGRLGKGLNRGPRDSERADMHGRGTLSRQLESVGVVERRDEIFNSSP